VHILVQVTLSSSRILLTHIWSLGTLAAHSQSPGNSFFSSMSPHLTRSPGDSHICHLVPIPTSHWVPKLVPHTLLSLWFFLSASKTVLLF
jgi:hypothetical protein